MRDVFIIGIGQTPVGEHWDLALRGLGAAAIRAALDDSRIETVDALFVGNMLGGAVNGQENDEPGEVVLSVKTALLPGRKSLS